MNLQTGPKSGFLLGLPCIWLHTSCPQPLTSFLVPSDPNIYNTWCYHHYWIVFLGYWAVWGSYHTQCTLSRTKCFSGFIRAQKHFSMFAMLSMSPQHATQSPNRISCSSALSFLEHLEMSVLSTVKISSAHTRCPLASWLHLLAAAESWCYVGANWSPCSYLFTWSHLWVGVNNLANYIQYFELSWVGSNKSTQSTQTGLPILGWFKIFIILTSRKSCWGKKTNKFNKHKWKQSEPRSKFHRIIIAMPKKYRFSFK